MHTAMARVTATFTIEARDAMGSPQQSGGEIFMVSVRGSSRVTAKVYDNEDGTYRAGRLPSATPSLHICACLPSTTLRVHVRRASSEIPSLLAMSAHQREVSRVARPAEYKPSTSGNYTIAVTHNGVALPDSPLPLLVLTPAPDPVRCVLRGEALKTARAREMATFEIEFQDALGQPARAEEIDVWVTRAEALADEATGSSVSSGDFAPAATSAPAPAEASSEMSPPPSPLPGDADDAIRRAQAAAYQQLRKQALARNGGRVEVSFTLLARSSERRAPQALTCFRGILFRLRRLVRSLSS